MTAQLTLGRVWGIPIRIHPSWFLIFALVAWSLAAGYFPVEYPGWGRATYWLVAAATSVLFFGSIVVHELGHSWVALRNGLRIRGITLFIFGGVAQIVREPASARVEFRIAVAGPLTSLGLGALFGGAWVLTRELDVLAAGAIWLARINLTVALFNLLPGFPLDGGRVLRALVWHRTGNFQRATRTAAFVGQVLASAFIVFGILVALGGNVLGGIWMAFIGWFLQNAAAATETQAGLRELLRGVTVAQVMTRDCPRVGRDWTLEQLVQAEVLGAGRRCFFVAEDGHLHGLVTLHEIKAVPRERWAEVRAGDVLTSVDRLAVAGPQEDLLVALERMDDANVAQLPVVAAGELVGVIGREHIVRYVRARAELGV